MKFTYPQVAHPNSDERKAAILTIFNGLAPQNNISLPTIVGSLQGPIKLSEDVKNDEEINLKEYMKNVQISSLVIEDDIDPNWTIHEQAVKGP